MRVIVINPWNQTVTQAEHNGNYRDYYRLLSGDTRDDCAPAKVDIFALADIGDPDQHIMFVDDEGLFRDPQAYFMLGGQSAVFAGRGVIARSDGGEDEVGATLTLEQVRASVTWAQDLLKYLHRRRTVDSMAALRRRCHERFDLVIGGADAPD